MTNDTIRQLICFGLMILAMGVFLGVLFKGISDYSKTYQGDDY